MFRTIVYSSKYILRNTNTLGFNPRSEQVSFQRLVENTTIIHMIRCTDIAEPLFIFVVTCLVVCTLPLYLAARVMILNIFSSFVNGVGDMCL